MTYQINNLDKFDEDCKKYSHSGGLNIQGTNLALHIKDFIKADRQEAYEAGRQSVIGKIQLDIFKIVNATIPQNADVVRERDVINVEMEKYFTSLINKLKGV
jgi:hypothetical protein